MIHAETLHRNLSELKPSEGVQRKFFDADWHVDLNMDRADGLASTLRSVVVRRDTTADASLSLHQWATNIAGRVKGLLEEVKVIEVDPTIDEALLRSDEPSVGVSSRSYYEIHLYGTHKATVERYRTSNLAGVRREAIGFTLTHEVLSKLVEDITKAANES